ncbi:MAG: hypothetical protein H8D80_02355 [Proteobacteria bacterium]|nr:hypothetical protein [Pseudomonadota bacterium]
MPAASYNIIAEQGTKWTLYLEYQTSGGTAIDLTSYNAQMQVRPSATSSNIILNFAGSTSSSSVTGGGSTGYYVSGTTGVSATGGIVLNASTAGVVGTTGGIYISADAGALSNTLSGEHRYDLELIKNMGSGVDDIIRLVEGEFKIKSEITK